MTQELPFPPAAAAGSSFGTAIASAITTFFGFVWLSWGFAFASAFDLTAWIGLYVVAIVLGVASVRAIIRGRALMKDSAVDGRSFWSRARGRFFAVVAAEIAGCFVVVWACNATHRADLLAAGIGIVVGLHFLPLATLFRFPAYFATGTVMVAACVASMLLFHGDPVTFFAGLVNGATLWLTAIVALARSQAFAQAASVVKR